MARQAALSYHRQGDKPVPLAPYIRGPCRRSPPTRPWSGPASRHGAPSSLSCPDSLLDWAARGTDCPARCQRARALRVNTISRMFRDADSATSNEDLFCHPRGTARPTNCASSTIFVGWNMCAKHLNSVKTIRVPCPLPDAASCVHDGDLSYTLWMPLENGVWNALRISHVLVAMDGSSFGRRSYSRR